MQLNFTHFIRAVLYMGIVVAGPDVMAQVKFSTVANPLEEGYVEVIYTIENARSVEDFSPPSFKNFKLLQGPSQSTSMTSINGVTSSSQSVSYILLPETTGKLTIEGATATIDGKTMHSGAVTVQMNKKGNSGGQRNIQPQMPDPFMDLFEYRPPVAEEYRLRPGEDVKEKIAKNFLVKLDVNRTSCYEGEPLMAIYKICSRLNSEYRVTKRPSLNGFSVYDMMDESDNNLQVEKINGKKFNVRIIRRSQLFPLQAGSYTLDPVELESKIQFVKVNTASSAGNRNPMQRIMERFPGREGEIEEHTVIMHNDPVTITVKPLPQANKPDGFKGAVGKFSIQAELKNKTIAAGDAALLKVMIRGTGNLPVVNAPDITLPAGMEAFDPVIKEDIDKTAYPLKGFKTFDYTFIAHDTGSFTIPPVRFSYFDPAAASYKTVSSGPFAIHILKGNKSSGSNLITSGTKVLTATQGWKEVIFSTSFLVSLIVILLIIIIYLLLKNRGQRGKALQPEAIVSKPTVEETIVKTTAPDPLQEAKMALHLGKSQEFYSEINKALRKAAASGEELSRETLQEMEAIRRECEIALYTPGYEDRDRQLILERAEKILMEN